MDSVDEPVAPEALEPRVRARATGLRRRPGVAALDALARARRRRASTRRGCAANCARSPRVTVRHHPDSTVAAMLLVGWLASRLDWQTELARHATATRWSARPTPAARTSRRCACRSAPELQVRGLEGAHAGDGLRAAVCASTAAPAGCAPAARDPRGTEREWTIPGASRGEAGVLGEGIRQALLRDPTYVPALTARGRCCRERRVGAAS